MSIAEGVVRKTKTHTVKCWPEYFEDIKEGKKPFDLRKDDRDYQVGDDVIQEEFKVHVGTYTGREVRVKITYVARGEQFERFGLKPGFCCLGIEVIP